MYSKLQVLEGEGFKKLLGLLYQQFFCVSFFENDQKSKLVLLQMVMNANDLGKSKWAVPKKKGCSRL
jgi:hypothetical protein